ncbi:uncharacterized protein LOC133714584 isoform X4 [Rosa rugosa]|uniref:uncharacterized protein LOC133714584 isoform X4 n=1 Tax=Rosa rugosa TaxID=74645 RepID=UPI002B40E01A|nr:uncharacterized protein LOC133714584 isoform X4 [Rosa rugosa]
MIANAMDGDDKLTAPQVTRKLKQLGLYIPWKKRSGANMLMRDQDLNDSNNVNASDDETLLSLMNRGKKDNIRISEVPEQITGREVAEDESDDEMLSSVLKKAKGSLSKLKDQNLTAILIQGNALENKVEEGVVSSGRFKDNHNSSHLIAEALDPDGKISSTQISNKLKQLGLKVARRKRLRHAQESVSAEPSQTDGDGEVEETVITHHESKTRPLHTRKRVSGLSEEQEARIRSLYDQFKDHNSCNHMIVTAMDGDDTLIAPQVSCKLKQLGLYIPRKKRSGSS